MTHDALAVTGDEVWHGSDRLFVVFVFVIEQTRSWLKTCWHWILPKVLGVFSIWLCSENGEYMSMGKHRCVARYL